jgi:hypothetical protein
VNLDPNTDPYLESRFWLIVLVAVVLPVAIVVFS